MIATARPRTINSLIMEDFKKATAALQHFFQHQQDQYAQLLNSVKAIPPLGPRLKMPELPPATEVKVEGENHLDIIYKNFRILGAKVDAIIDALDDDQYALFCKRYEASLSENSLTVVSSNPAK